MLDLQAVFAIGLLALGNAMAPPAAAQAGPVSLSAFGFGGPCGDRICPPLSDPLARDGFVLRLATPLRRPDTSGMPGGGYGGQASTREVIEWQARNRERAEKNPIAWLFRGAGEAHAGRFAAAQPLLQKALDLSVADGDPQAEATSLSNLGVVAAMQGRYDDARSRMEAALAIFVRLEREPQLPPGLATPQLPQVPGLVIPPAKAEVFAAEYRRRMLQGEAQSARRGAFVVQLNLGSVAASLAQYGDAIARFRQAVELGKSDANDGSERTALGELAQLYRKAGDEKEAARYRRNATAKPAAEDEQRLAMSMSEVSLGGAALVAKEPPAARAEPQAPASPPLSPAAQQLKQRLEGMMASAAQAQMAQSMPLYAACDNGQCTSPGDPALRTGYGMRLASAMRVPFGTAQAQGKATFGPGSPLFLNAAGVKIASQGRLDAAREQWIKALQGSADGRDPLMEAVALSNLGAADAIQGRHDEARSRLKSAFAAYDKLASAKQRSSAAAMNGGPFGMGGLQGLPAMQDGGNAAAGKLLVALNLANLEAHLVRYSESEAWFERALESALRDGHGSKLVLSEMAAMNRLRGRQDAAADHVRRSQAGTDVDDTWKQVEVGFVVLGTSAPAATAQRVQSPAAPPARSDTAAPTSEVLQGAASEVLHARLTTEAAERERTGDVAGAIAALGRAALLAAASGNAERERAALAGLQRLQAQRGNAEAAIFHGKRSVNAIQRQRQSLAHLDRAARQSFLAEKKQTYVLLAQTLMDRKRLPEAEQVLRLLKEDEGQQVQEAARGRGTVPYSALELTALQAFDRLVERIRPLETRRASLAGGISLDGPVDSRAAIERARLLNLNRADHTLATLEVAGDIDEAVERCRRLSAKAPAARSAADADQLADCTLTLRAVVAAMNGGAESVRALKDDAARFLTPPSNVELRQIDALLARFVAQQAKLAQVLALVREAPAGPGAQLGPTPGFAGLLVDSGRLHELWVSQLEIDGLMSQVAGLENRLDVTLAQRGDPDFTATGRAALETGSRLMKALPAGTAAIYYLGGEQRLDILVVSAHGWTQARADISRAALAQRITAFRRVLNMPTADPVPLARDLYRLLMTPVEAALKAARATTLMIALEGPLRYVPFSALHDGEGWLAERYATSLYTTAAPTALTAEPARAWQAAAFGSTAVGTGLPLLPAVKQELQAIVHDPAQGTQGVMPGVIRLDRDFTALALRDALRKRPNVVHIASHFAFQAEDAGASFLLLGDGGHLTLNQLGAAEFRFDQVDLVTLSACETALVAGNSFGQEVEALGTLLQAQGASAVLSTLWSIADASTAQFMRRLYEARESSTAGLARVSRAQALQAAQLSFIRPRATGTAVVAARVIGPAASAGQRGGSRAGDSPFQPDPSRPYAHPYFWAPFVLMGNWL